jgi:serine/threonine-protein kinase
MIEPGRMLLHYRLVEKIGEGGMGVVWKALDTSLDREVAIKILPEPFGRDTERMARFEREAKLLATLNHPNIAGVYGLHEAEGVRFIAMELVSGEDLAARLARGPLTIENSLTVALKVAEALEAAHESGVIHRDLKPANIVRAEDGTLKVLDFGLAKAFDPSSSSSSADPAFSPTMTSAGSHAGMVLGTASYMSPEQARGKPVDKRSDIWSFGVVLHEVLAGKRPFEGETISDTIAMILQTEPDWSGLPANTPPRVRELLQRCLEKDARNRVRDIGDARIEIEKAVAAKEWTGEIPAATREAAAPVAARPKRRWVPFAALAAGAVIGAALMAALGPRSGSGSAPLRVSIESPPDVVARNPELTPDGRTLVFYGDRENLDPSEAESTRIFVRPLESATATPLAETEDASVSAISPDGRWLAYVAPVKQGAAQKKIFKVPLDGSAPPMTLADWHEDWSDYMLWLPDDRILVSSQNPVVLVKIATDGSGSRATVTAQFPETVPELELADALPDGIHVLGTSYSWEGQGFHDQTFVLNTQTGTVKKLLEDGSHPHWSETGHLVFTRQETLLAAPFDPDALELLGGPVTLADGLRTNLAEASAGFELSPGGALVHQSGGRVGSRRRIISIDEDGTVTPWSDDRLAFQTNLDVSRDGRHLATTVMKDDDLLFSVWVSEVGRPRLRLWKAMDGLDCDQAAWHPDNRRLVYNCVGETEQRGVYIAPLDDGEPPRLLWRDDREGNFSTVRAIHPSGRHVLVDVTSPEGISVVRVPTEESGAPHPGVPAFPDRRGTYVPAFSPDGAWVSYSSNDSGRAELFVAPFDARDGSTGRATLVTSTATGPAGWYEESPGVFVLSYAVGPWRAEKVRVRTSPRLSISDPEPFMDFSGIRPQLVGLHLRPDGRWMGIQRDQEEAGTRRMDLILNFDRELEKIGQE